MAEETERVAVSTYVPTYQRDRWRADADRLEMSQSEFVRTMVQAGRRGFDLGCSSDDDSEETGARADSDRNPGGSTMEDAVLDRLRETDHLSWDELVAELTSDVEDRLEATLDELQARDRIRYRGRRGGYALAEGTDGE